MILIASSYSFLFAMILFLCNLVDDIQLLEKCHDRHIPEEAYRSLDIHCRLIGALLDSLAAGAYTRA